jgi:hypothetical protein
MRAVLRVLAVLAAAALSAACASAGPALPFVPAGPAYDGKPDFARVERLYPLTPAARAAVTPGSLARLTQEQFDQLYARLTAGPIPDGPYQGTIVLADGGGLRRLPQLLGGAKGFVSGLGLDALTHLAAALWKGKLFAREERVARTIVEHPGVVAKLLAVDLTGMRTGVAFGRRVGLLFPAKLYCGQSLLDSRRESVILDAAYNDEIDGYLPAVDALAGRHGLGLRDEIRMIRPGLYLGRAYLGRIFVLDFILYSPGVAAREQAAFARTGEVEEPCWTGSARLP